MRNRFPGICFRCKEPVGAQKGHFERVKRQGAIPAYWRVQHAECAIAYRGTDVGKKTIIPKLRSV